MSLKGELLTILQNKERTIFRTGTNVDFAIPPVNVNLFNIAGGPIAVTGMFGHVTVAFTGALVTPLLQYFPAVTGVGGVTAICTVAVGAAHAVDVILTWDGLLASVLAPTVGLGHGQSGPVESFDGGYILMLPGVVRMNNAGGADATAVVNWYMTYRPLNPATVVTVL